MAGPVSVTCPTCGRSFPVPAEVLGVDGHQVIVRMDRTDLYGHLSTCAGTAGEQAGREQAKARHPAGKGLANRTETAPLVAPPFVAKGKRPCVLCGTHAPDCLTGLQASGPACCPGCESGNTHPAPQDTVPCAVWAADR